MHPKFREVVSYWAVNGIWVVERMIGDFRSIHVDFWNKRIDAGSVDNDRADLIYVKGSVRRSRSKPRARREPGITDDAISMT
jgi:hypothetical protein